MEAELQQRILKAVDDRGKGIAGLLQKLVQFDSETGKEGSISEFIAGTLNRMGLSVDSFDLDLQALSQHPAFIQPRLPVAGRPNVVGTWKGTGGGRSLLFNGHVDTVPSEPLDQWFDGAFSGLIKDGKIWGRGASDMKSGLAAMTMAVAILKDLGLRPKGDVILEYTVDEELSGMGTLACVLRGYKADAGICCETSNLEVMPACIGRMWFTIKLRGKPSGISARWESVSAIEKGLKIVQAVDDLEKMRIADLKHPLFPDNRGALPCAVTMFQSGTFPSVTPEHAVLRGSFGTMPSEQPAEVLKQLKDQVNRVAMADPWLRNNPPEVAFEGLVAPGAEIPADHPIVETLKGAFQTATGKPPVVSGRKGGADTRFLIPYGGIPTVIFGPGITPQMHAMNEFVPVDNLMVATKVMALSILEWCN
jgi:acetylornithine deacetylase